MGFDIIHPRLRDRRIAAADEAISTKNGYIYGRGTNARRRSEEAPDEFDVRRIGYARPPHRIDTIILHLTTGRRFLASHLPPEPSDRRVSSDSDIDNINAHIVALYDGTVVYTRDVLHILNNKGGGRGIDIEFAGRYGLKDNPAWRPGSRVPRYIAAEDPNDSIERLPHRAIESARLLIRFLARHLPIVYIHPHGQFTAVKARTCPGPDIWINVGDWACENLRLKCERDDQRYRSDRRNRSEGIDPQQRNYGYFQEF